MTSFRVIQGCPVPALIAPYVYILLQEIGGTLNSAYRGEDAKAILHAHGKHTQAEIHQELPAISNPPGRSSHELRSDGVCAPGPVGRKLEEWQCGLDVNDSDVVRMEAHAKAHHWMMFQPYKRGVEFHHVMFRFRPRPDSLKQRLKIIHLRLTLPRR